MKCSHCGNDVTEGQVCPECGTPLTCPVCGAQVKARMRFCNKCGAKLTQEAPEQPVQPVVPAAEEPSVTAEVPEEAAVTAEAAAPEEERSSVAEEVIAQELPEETGEESVEKIPAVEETAEEEAAEPLTAEETSAEVAEAAPAAEEVISEESAPEAAAEAVTQEAAPVAEAVTQAAAPAAEVAPAKSESAGMAKLHAFADKVKGKMGAKTVDGLGLWLPAALPIFWGALILLFLISSAVQLGGFSLASGYEVMSGSIVGTGAAVGAVMCLICGIGFIAMGILRIVLAAKRPHYIPKFVIPVQLALYAVTFIMSCVMVGSINSEMMMNASGPAGNCILAFTIVGMPFVAFGIFLFKSGCVNEIVDKRKAAAEKYKAEKASKVPAIGVVAGAAVAGAVAVGAGVAAGASAQQYQQVVYVQGGEASLDEKLFGHLRVNKNIKNYRWLGGIGSMVALILLAIVTLIPISSRNGETYSMFSFLLDVGSESFNPAAVYLPILYFITLFLSLAHAVNSITKPYTQHPILDFFQVLFMGSLVGMYFTNFILAMIYGNDFSDMIGCVIASVILGFISICLLIVAPILVVCARSDQNRYLIKKQRLELREHHDKKKETPAKVFIVIATVIAMAAFVLSVCMPLLAALGDRGMDTSTANGFYVGQSYSSIVDTLGEPYEQFEYGNGREAYWYSNDFEKLFPKEEDSSGDDWDNIEDWDDLEGALEDAMKEEAERQEKLENLVYKYYVMTFDENDELEYMIFNNSVAYTDRNEMDKTVDSASAEIVESNYNSHYYGDSVDFVVNVNISYTDGSVEKGRVDSIYSFAMDEIYGTEVLMYSAEMSDERVALSLSGNSAELFYAGNAGVIDTGSVLWIIPSVSTSGNYEDSGVSPDSNTDVVIATSANVDELIAELASSGRISGFYAEMGNYTGTDGGSLYKGDRYSGYTLLYASHNDMNSNESIFDTLPDIDTIASYAFAGTSITSLSGMDGVTTLEDYAFGESSLASVTIPNTVTSVGSYLFDGCSSGTVTLDGRSGIPSSWPTDWNYRSSGSSWTVEYGVPDLDPVTITFNKNAGGTVSNMPSTITLEAGETLSYPSSIPTRNGYVFAGWYDNSRGSGSPYDFSADITEGSRKTLYAKWISYSGNSTPLTYNDTNGLTVDVINKDSSPRTQDYYAFVPLASGDVTLYSNGGLSDTVGYLYGSSNKESELEYDNNDGDGNNFSITRYLNAGTLYYLRPAGHSSSGSTTIYVEGPAPAEGGTVVAR